MHWYTRIVKLFFATSTIPDGSMKSPDHDFAAVLPARTAFLQKNGSAPADTTLVYLTYETDDFCRYQTVVDGDKGDGITRRPTIEADALVVTQPGHALLLPLADCIGAVIHDPVKNILMVSHLGRHNLEQLGGTKSIDYLVAHHDVDPATVTVWLSPAAGKDSYPLYGFDNRGLHEVAIEQLTVAGILRTNMTVSPINSAADLTYFSHSKFLKGDRENDGRFAIVAMMRS